MLMPVYKAVEAVKKVAAKKKSVAKKKNKLAGVGYTTSIGKAWDVNAYLKNK